jgi:hypothetical protein
MLRELATVHAREALQVLGSRLGVRLVCRAVAYDRWRSATAQTVQTCGAAPARAAAGVTWASTRGLQTSYRVPYVTGCVHAFQLVDALAHVWADTCT